MFILELLFVLACLYIGSRFGGIVFGLLSGVGLAILVFVFGLAPGTPPTDVLYIIIAAVTCAGTFQAAGGMSWLTQLAEKVLRKHPQQITFLAPLCTFFLTVLIGTGHIVYTLMPIIVDVSIKNGVRPERPCAVASVSSQLGIMASPIAAAVVAFSVISSQNGFDITIPQILMVSLPSALAGLLCAAGLSMKRGKDLDKDPAFQELISNPERREFIYSSSDSCLGRQVGKKEKMSTFILLGAILTIVVLAACGYKTVKMNLVIQIIMLVAACLMVLLCKVKASDIARSDVWRNGMVAVVVIYGVAWMADTLFSNYMASFQESFGGIIETHPWTIAVAFFLASILLNSQGATVVAMVPIAFAMGIPGYIILGALPCTYAYFFIPNYPSDIATVNFDKTGTTHIGRYLLNHSFMMPGLVSVGIATCISMLLSFLIFGN